MKPLLLTLLAALPLTGYAAGADALIRGTAVDTPDGTKVWLSVKDDSGVLQRTDGTVVHGGVFQLPIDPVRVDYVALEFGHRKTPLWFFLEPGEIRLDVDYGRERGWLEAHSPLNDVNRAYQEKDRIFLDPILEISQRPPTDSLRKIVVNLLRQRDSLKNHYIRDYTGKYFTSYLLTLQSTRGYTPAQLDSLIALAGDVAPNRFLDELREARQAAAENKLIGRPAPDFTLPRADGTPFTLSSLRGQVVLIDVWASWCGPCRAENPALVRMYERYKERGLAIVGISQDTDRKAWLDAVEKDGLPWIHVSDLRENREVKRLYGMDNAVPYTVVVDRDGRIAATLLRGAELEAAIVRELKNE